MPRRRRASFSAGSPRRAPGPPLVGGCSESRRCKQLWAGFSAKIALLWNVCPGEPPLGCTVSPSLILKGTAELGPTVAAPACICPHSTHERSGSWRLIRSRVCTAVVVRMGAPPAWSAFPRLRSPRPSNLRILCQCVRETCSPPAPGPVQPLWNAAWQDLLTRSVGAPCTPAQSEEGVSDRTVL